MGEQTWAWNQFDQTGNVTATIGVAGVQQSLGWSANSAMPGSLTVGGAGGFQDTMTWTAFGALATQTAVGTGMSSTTVYDLYARPYSKTSPTGAVTYYTYTNASASAAATVTATTNGRWVRETLDGFGRTVKTETGYGTTTVSAVQNVYEPCACSPIGKLKKTSRPYAGNGAPSAWTVYSYDSLGRTISIVAPDGASTTSFAYVGNTLTVTDAQQKWKTHQQDAFGNLELVTEPRPGGGTYTTNYTYNRFNQLLTVSMPRDGVTQTRTFTYWPNGKLKSRQEPETGTVQLTYNNYGMLSTKLDQKGQATTYTYDPVYRRLKKIEKYPAGTSFPADACQAVDFYWDSAPYGSNFSAGAYRRMAAVEYRGTRCGQTNGNKYLEEYAYTVSV